MDRARCTWPEPAAPAFAQLWVRNYPDSLLGMGNTCQVGAGRGCPPQGQAEGSVVCRPWLPRHHATKQQSRSGNCCFYCQVPIYKEVPVFVSTLVCSTQEA